MYYDVNKAHHILFIVNSYFQCKLRYIIYPKTKTFHPYPKLFHWTCKDYLITNREHNGFLEKDSLLTFDLMAHTHGEPPNAIVDWPSVGLSFANPDDSGLGGGGQGNIYIILQYKSS